MRSVIVALVLGLAMTACGDGWMEAPNVVDSGGPAECAVKPIASITGCTTQPLPLPFVDPDVGSMTVYIDGVAIAPADWTTDGHAVRLVCSGAGDVAQHLVAVSFGCVATH